MEYYTLMMQSYSFPLTSEPILTIDNLVGAMEKVTSDKERRREVWEKVLDWKENIPDSYLDEVFSKYTSDRDTCTLNYLMFTNGRPDSSWKHLQIYTEGEVAAANEAEPFL